MRDFVAYVYILIGAGSAFGVNLQFDDADVWFRIFVSIVSVFMWPAYIGMKLVAP